MNTIGLGFVASGASYLLASGTGKRVTTENTRIMIHSVQSSSKQMSFPDMQIDYKEAEFLQSEFIKQIHQFSGTSIEKLESLMQRDKYLTPIESKELGLIDDII